jgi:hypothetical protein
MGVAVSAVTGHLLLDAKDDPSIESFQVASALA